MSTCTDACAVALVDLPPSLMRADLIRRQPAEGSRFVNFVGKKYDDCEVIGFAGFLDQFAAFLYLCKCGNKFIGRGSQIGHRGGQSCGCNNHSEFSEAARLLYHTWISMKRRCFNDKDAQYHYYGERGITVCMRWCDSLEAFAADMGPKPSPQHSIDRVDNDGNYQPNNCRWATSKQQGDNSRGTRHIEHNGVRKNLSDWAADIGVSRERIRQRVNKCIDMGADLSEAVTTPAGEVMPCCQKAIEKRSAIKAKEAQFLFGPELFNGSVHHMTLGDISPLTRPMFDQNARNICTTGGMKARIRWLGEHVLFQAQQATK